jgi:hypothetical protein
LKPSAGWPGVAITSHITPSQNIALLSVYYATVTMPATLIRHCPPQRRCHYAANIRVTLPAITLSLERLVGFTPSCHYAIAIVAIALHVIDMAV